MYTKAAREFSFDVVFSLTLQFPTLQGKGWIYSYVVRPKCLPPDLAGSGGKVR
jgi:hypothetical protein